MIDMKSLDKRVLLNELERVLKEHPELEHTLYLEFNRRYEVLRLVLRYKQPPANLVEAGASPFLLSAMLKLAGFNVIALDVEPEEYIDIANMFNIDVIKVDLERDRVPLPDEGCNIVVMSEVLEHLSPYYVSHTLAELNRILKKKGILVLTTPNVASLFRRLKLLVGKNPIYKLHVKEYTLNEVLELLKLHGFNVIEFGYLEINDRCFLKVKTRKWLRRLPYVENYLDMLKLTLHNINLTNVLRLAAYPIVKVRKSLRMLIYVVAEKSREVSAMKVRRW